VAEDAGGESALVCAACLSRLHRACWAEGAGCSGCRGEVALHRAPALEAAAPRAADGPGYHAALESWLKLALVYNAVLGVITLGALGTAVLAHYGFQVVDGAILANLCFLLGPAVDLGALKLGFRGPWLRAFLFTAGLGLASLLTLMCCLI